jgi:CubicO group peptidase (beta-lactamase class C family)
MIRPVSVLLCIAAGAAAVIAQTGAAVPGFESLDREIPVLMQKAHVPGAAVAVVKDGRLIFARGYGVANRSTGEAFQPDSLCRIGSISKTVTAVTILKLLEAGKLSLDDKVFAGILTQLQPPPGAHPDARLKEISVRQLLHHTGGHGRDTGTDPLNIGLAQSAAAAFHLPMPPGYDAMVRYAMGLPLDSDPGTQYSYSNYGFTVLARVIERVTGQPYEDVVRQQVLAPLGLRRMAVGKSLPEGRFPGEVYYYDTPRAPLVFSLLARERRLVPLPYANFELEAGDGSGRWIASAVDLARFVARVEGSRSPALLAPPTLQLLFERPDPFVTQAQNGEYWYALGTVAFPFEGGMAWTHGGFYPGATAGYESFGNGYLFAFVFNATPDNDTFTGELYRVLETAGLTRTDWPSHDLFPSYFPED